MWVWSKADEDATNRVQTQEQAVGGPEYAAGRPGTAPEFPRTAAAPFVAVPFASPEQVVVGAGMGTGRMPSGTNAAAGHQGPKRTSNTRQLYTDWLMRMAGGDGRVM